MIIDISLEGNKHWRCKFDKCSASLTINENDEILTNSGFHDHTAFTDLNVNMWKFRERVCNRVQNEISIDMRSIYNQEFKLLIDQFGLDSISEEPDFPTYTRLRSTLERRRKILTPALPSDTDNLILSEKYTSKFIINS